jgi:hypothetical protein
MARLRYTDVVGTIAAGNLTNSATSHTFTAPLTYGGGSTVVPTLAGTDYFMLSILTTAGAVAEVVKVTAYNSGTGAATLVRGQEGTTGTAATSGQKVTIAAYPSDFPGAGVKAYRSAGYTLAHETVTAVPWDAEEWDTDGFHDNSTNSQRLTVPTGLAGKYLVIGSVGTTGSGSYARFLVMIQVNGSDVRGGRTEGGISASGFPVLQASTVVDLAVGDYVTVSYYQSSGTTRAMDTANCAFSMHRIG